ncbi:hypothetical protein PIB30_078855 [Stylosanthes scabra]|uniref:Uncharacterized protein n=1 Tax=Stylosanthes scabra TaxID=79078 RepID=A0ABU6XRF4_9FABA|nr:hypothetical protein [Stylosanthes scabra]
MLPWSSTQAANSLGSTATKTKPHTTLLSTPNSLPPTLQRHVPLLSARLELKTFQYQFPATRINSATLPSPTPTPAPSTATSPQTSSTWAPRLNPASSLAAWTLLRSAPTPTRTPRQQG